MCYESYQSTHCEFLQRPRIVPGKLSTPMKRFQSTNFPPQQLSCSAAVQQLFSSTAGHPSLAGSCRKANEGSLAVRHGAPAIHGYHQGKLSAPPCPPRSHPSDCAAVRQEEAALKTGSTGSEYSGNICGICKI